ncbi:MAG: TIGR02646 family protein [Bacteroidetes bacterium]|nr:MAG: TIGR02646 family protein [Bacteroidota bacterium]
MKQIIKSNEPFSLTEHRSSQHANFENLPKDDVRTSLLTEQGHICCYCMKRIPETNINPSTKIEHFLCQANHPDQELNYSNMLLACSGQQGSPKHLQTCDTRKGNQTLSFNPSDRIRNIEDLIKYKSNGEIYSSDERLNEELENVLNLNMNTLKINRRIIYEEIQKRIMNEGRRIGNRAMKRRFLEQEKAKLLSLNDGKFREFCMVSVYVIDKKLRRMN